MRSHGLRHRFGSVSLSRLLLLSLPLFPTPGSVAQPQAAVSSTTVTVSSRLVEVDVTVTDSAGNPIRGLTAAQFHLAEDGRPQVLTSFHESPHQSETSSGNRTLGAVAGEPQYAFSNVREDLSGR